VAKRARWTSWDLLVPVGVVVLGVAGVFLAPPHQPGWRDRDALAVVLTLAQGAPLVLRRRLPLPVLAVVWSATAAFFAFRFPPVTSALAGLAVATYAVAAYDTSQGKPLPAAATVVLDTGLIAIAVLTGYGATEATVMVLLFVMAWVLGDRARTRRQYLEALEERARLLERERETQVEAAAAAERTRIARELHDVIAHGVSVIVLHARGAKEVIERDPGASRRSLELIEHTGREALQELRTVVGALRGDGSKDPLEPQPGLAHMEELVRRTEEAGLGVSVTVEGQVSPLPPAVELSAYRIVQEALANTLKHSTATSADVVIRYGDDQLLVQVSDSGRARDGSHLGGGHGLVGMRERVALLGGRIETGPRPEGGYEVFAVLPLAPNRP
jgi:signal transduction histidine kinase